MPKFCKNVLLIKLVVIVLYLDMIYCCSDDCTQQAGVPCDITNGIEACSRNDTNVEGFPDKLDTFDVSHVVFPGGNVGLNVSWANNNLEHGQVQGYRLQYWIYIDNKDPNKGTLDQCVVYGFTSGHTPDTGTSFNHTCVLSPTRVIQISTLPQQNPDTDYVHRVTVGYSQDYGLGNPALWQPPLVVIHNDSCSGEVTVQLYLAPAVFEFRKYRVSLVNTENSNSPVDNDITASPGDKFKTTKFSGVQEGHYYLHIVAEPDDRGVKCRCYVDFCDFHHCVLSTTNTFLIKDDHSKCPKLTTTDIIQTTPHSTTETPTTLDIVEIIVIVTLVVAFLALMAIVVLYFHRNRNVCTKLLNKIRGTKENVDHDNNSETDNINENYGHGDSVSTYGDVKYISHPDNITSVTVQRHVSPDSDTAIGSVVYNRNGNNFHISTVNETDVQISAESNINDTNTFSNSDFTCGDNTSYSETVKPPSVCLTVTNSEFERMNDDTSAALNTLYAPAINYNNTNGHGNALSGNFGNDRFIGHVESLSMYGHVSDNTQHNYESDIGVDV